MIKFRLGPAPSVLSVTRLRKKQEPPSQQLVLRDGVYWLFVFSRRGDRLINKMSDNWLKVCKLLAQTICPAAKRCATAQICQIQLVMPLTSKRLHRLLLQSRRPACLLNLVKSLKHPNLAQSPRRRSKRSWSRLDQCFTRFFMIDHMPINCGSTENSICGLWLKAVSNLTEAAQLASGVQREVTAAD
eukprot:g32182.t1